jgi:hypothetical protein
VKTFYSLEYIESLVAQGVRELIVDEDAVLTDVARDAAAGLGLKLLPKGYGPAAPAQPLPSVAAASGGKPRGCQHGPLGGGDPRETRGQTGTAQAPKAARPGSPSGVLVDDLVGAVRQMASKGSAG